MSLSKIKQAWGNILERYGENMTEDGDWNASPSILDQIQTEYRAGRITEAQRDAMRVYVREWLGDPDAPPAYLPQEKREDNQWAWLYGPRRDPMQDYARYACGVWAGSTGPMGEDEHAIILMTVQLLKQEAA